MSDPTSTVRLLIALALLVLLAFLGAAAMDVWAMRTELRIWTLAQRAGAAARKVPAAVGRRWLAARCRASELRFYVTVKYTGGIH